MSQDHPNHTGHILADRYEIIDEIGRGGFGMVYRARQMNMDRQVAIKVLPPQFMAVADVVERFKREAHLSSRLKHPNTITIHDYGQANDLLFIVMELLDGEDLADVLKRERTLEQERILHIARQVLKSLQEAHGEGIVHRDLKPENIYLTRMGAEQDFVKVLDFGIAKLAEPGGDGSDGRRLTVTGSTVGTPVYMSPEQAAGEEVDSLTDLYALGVIMYEMATGQPPFNDTNPVKIMRAHLFTEVAPFPEDCPLSGSPIERVVMRALHKEKPLRIQSAEEFLRALDASEPQITALPQSLFSLRPPPTANAATPSTPATKQEEPPTLEWYDDPPSEDSIEISREDTSTFDRISNRRQTSENNALPNLTTDAVPFGAFPNKQPPRQPVRESAMSASAEISGLSNLADQISRGSLFPGGPDLDDDDETYDFHEMPPPLHQSLGNVSSIITVVDMPPPDEEVFVLTQPKTSHSHLDLGKGGQAPAGDAFLLQDESIIHQTPSAGVSQLHLQPEAIQEPPLEEELTPGAPPQPHAALEPAAAPAPAAGSSSTSNEIDPGAPPEDPSAEWSWDPKRSKQQVRNVESGAYPQLKDKRQRQMDKKKENGNMKSMLLVLFLLGCLLAGAVVALVALGVIKLP